MECRVYGFIDEAMENLLERYEIKSKQHTIFNAMTIKDLIRDYPVAFETPIAWGDMDAFQHVNNVVYFKLFESARIAYFEEINFLEVMNRTGVGPILAKTECKFKIPLTYPDRVTAVARVPKIEEDRFVMRYAVVSHRHNNFAAIGEGTLVTFNYQNNEKVCVPEEIRKSIIELENSVNQNFKK